MLTRSVLTVALVALGLLAARPAHAEPPPPALGAVVARHVEAEVAGCRPRLVEVPDPQGGSPIHAVLCDAHGVLATAGDAQ